jgi:hypothetical protein
MDKLSFSCSPISINIDCARRQVPLLIRALIRLPAKSIKKEDKMEALKLGTLVVRGCPVKIPEQPRWRGDTFGCNSPDIEIADTQEGKEIRWLPLDSERFGLPKDRQIYICDRAILIGVSWDTLEKAGFAEGKQVMIDGKACIIRLMTGSDGSEDSYGPGCANEWDMMMDQYGEDDNITHWDDMYTWCRETDCDYSSNRSVRGYASARDYSYDYATGISTNVGFRPALEILNTEETTA